MIAQRTLKDSISAMGIGLHKGDKVNITMRPAPANTGILFRRTDLSPAVDIPVRADAVSDTVMCTCLSNESGVSVATIEHLMSALAGLGIDNVVIEVDANEVPIMDGSACPFVYLINSVGIEEQNALKRFIRVKKTVRVEEGDKWAELRPHNGFKVDFSIEFNHPVINGTKQQMVLDFDSASYVKEVSRARTFGFMKDLEFLRANNLALGASMQNAVAMDDFRVLNPEGLRSDDEFVQHKILDAIGDLYVVGHSLIGEVVAHKSGHSLNNLLIRELMADETAWEYVSYEDPAETPISYGLPSYA